MANMQAVDTLTTMFPSIERTRIQTILVDECGGDSNQAIVILSKIDQFNQSVRNQQAANVAGTSHAGEAIQPTTQVAQQIPLQIVSPQPYAQPAAQDDCCACDGCSPCCNVKPASYQNGLYAIDFTMYNISFFVFAALSFYPEITIDSLDVSLHGLYLPPIALIVMVLASVMSLCIKKPVNDPSLSCVNFARGCLFILAGLLYFIGYIIHAATLPDDDHDYYWWESDIYSEPSYLVCRGAFVGIHAIFIGYLYVTGNRLLCQCCNGCGGPRINIIRWWTVLYLVYSIGCLLFVVPWFFAIYNGGIAYVFIISLFFNFCLLRRSNEAGGCNSGATLALLQVITYYMQVVVIALWVLFNRLAFDWTPYEEPGWYVLWEFALFIFGALQLWILLRAMHPVAANCGCIQHGSGDGNVQRVRALSVQPAQPVHSVQQPTQIVMVVPSQNAAPTVTAAVHGGKYEAVSRDGNDHEQP